MRFVLHLLWIYSVQYIFTEYICARKDYDVLLQSGFEAIIGELIQHEDRYTIELLIKM